MKKYRYLIARRFTQSVILLLFMGGNIYGWKILRGNLSSARLLDAVPLSDPFAVLQGLSAGAPAAGNAVTGAVIIGLTYALIGGRLFCGWVCPMNFITDTANRLRKAFGFDAQFGTPGMKKTARYWIAALSLILSVILGTAAFELVSPIGMLHRGLIYGMGLGWTFVLAVFLLDMFAVRHGFCGHICPLGAFYAMIGRYGFLRIGYDRKKCTLCMKCTDICPEKQVLDIVGKQSGPVLSGECINCGRCVEICNDNALNFRSIYSGKQNYS